MEIEQLAELTADSSALDLLSCGLSYWEEEAAAADCLQVPLPELVLLELELMLDGQLRGKLATLRGAKAGVRGCRVLEQVFLRLEAHDDLAISAISLEPGGLIARAIRAPIQAANLRQLREDGLRHLLLEEHGVDGAGCLRSCCDSSIDHST